MDYEVIKEFKGSPDGHTVITYKVGDEVSEETMGADLLKVALEEKWVAKPKNNKAKAKAEAEAKAQAEAAAAAKAEAIATLQADLEQLTDELNASADVGGDTAPIQAQIDAKQAELDALLA